MRNIKTINGDVGNIIVQFPMHFVTKINGIEGIVDITKALDLIRILEISAEEFSGCRDDINIFREDNGISTVDGISSIKVSLGNYELIFSSVSKLKLKLYYYMILVLDNLERYFNGKDSIGISMAENEIIYRGEKFSLEEFFNEVIETLLISDNRIRFSEFLNSNIIRSLHRQAFLFSNNTELGKMLSTMNYDTKLSIEGTVYKELWKPYVLKQSNIDCKMSTVGNFISWKDVVKQINYAPTTGAGTGIFYSAHKGDIARIINNSVKSNEVNIDTINVEGLDKPFLNVGSKLMSGKYFKIIASTPKLLVAPKESTGMDKFTKEGYNLFFKDAAIRVLKENIKREIGQEHLELLHLPINPLEDNSIPLDNKVRSRLLEVAKKDYNDFKFQYGTVFDPPVIIEQDNKESRASSAKLSTAIKSNPLAYTTIIRDMKVYFKELIKHCICVGVDPLSFNILDIALECSTANEEDNYSIKDYILMTEVKSKLKGSDFREKTRNISETSGIYILEKMRKEQENKNKYLKAQLRNILVQRPDSLEDNGVKIVTKKGRYSDVKYYSCSIPINELITGEEKYDVDFKDMIPNRLVLAARSHELYGNEISAHIRELYTGNLVTDVDNSSISNRVIRDNYKPLQVLDPGGVHSLRLAEYRKRVSDRRLELANQLLTDYLKPEEVTKVSNNTLRIGGEVSTEINRLKSSYLKFSDLLVVETMASLEVGIIKEYKNNGVFDKELEKLTSNELSGDIIDKYIKIQNNLFSIQKDMTRIKYNGNSIEDSIEFIDSNLVLIREEDIKSEIKEVIEEYYKYKLLIEDSTSLLELTEDELIIIEDFIVEANQRLLNYCRRLENISERLAGEKGIELLSYKSLVFKVLDILFSKGAYVEIYTENYRKDRKDSEVALIDIFKSPLGIIEDISFNEMYSKFMSMRDNLDDNKIIDIMKLAIYIIENEIINIKIYNTETSYEEKYPKSNRALADLENIVINNLLAPIRDDLRSDKFETLEEILSKYNLNSDKVLSFAPTLAESLTQHFDQNIISDVMREDLYDSIISEEMRLLKEKKDITRMKIEEYIEYRNLGNINLKQAEELKTNEINSKIDISSIRREITDSFINFRDGKDYKTDIGISFEKNQNEILKYLTFNNSRFATPGSMLKKIIFNEQVQNKTFSKMVGITSVIGRQLGEDIGGNLAVAIAKADRVVRPLSAELTYEIQTVADTEEAMKKLGKVLSTKEMPTESKLQTAEEVITNFLRDDNNKYPIPKIHQPDLSLLESSVSKAVLDAIERVLKANEDLDEDLGLIYYLRDIEQSYNSVMGEEFTKLPDLVISGINKFKTNQILKETKQYCKKMITEPEEVQQLYYDAEKYVKTEIDSRLESEIVSYLVNTITMDELPVDNSKNVLRTYEGKIIAFKFGGTKVYLDSRGNFVVNSREVGKLRDKQKVTKIPSGISYEKIASVNSNNNNNKIISKEALDNILLPYKDFVNLYKKELIIWVANEIKESMVSK